jgi:hypothetical protein
MTEINNNKIFETVRYGTPPNVAMKKISTLIRQGTDPNLVLYKDYDISLRSVYNRMHYLHCPLITVAIMEGHLHIVKTLIENGANHTPPSIGNYTYNNPLEVAILKWYKSYIYKCSKCENQYHVPCKLPKYQIFWPEDEELKSYRILKYLLSIGGKISFDGQLNGLCIKNKWLEREIRQRKVDWLFEQVLNVNTNTNIGTMIVRSEKHVFGLDYLLYSDVLF